MKRSKQTALAALFSAIGCVLLFFGSATNLLDISCAGLASLLVLLAHIEMKRPFPQLIYAVTSVLSILLLPDKFSALLYLLITGWYPFLKRTVESHLSVAVGWAVKLVAFNIEVVLLFLATRFILGQNEINTLWLYIAAAVIANVAFVLFDIVLTRLITIYFFRYRQRFKKLFK